jgi:hypothetical protein
LEIKRGIKVDILACEGEGNDVKEKRGTAVCACR